MKFFDKIRHFVNCSSDAIPSVSVHHFSLSTLEGKKMSFKQFNGKKILIVNVASECGLTPQYEKLQQLYINNADRLVVVGVPCNDFAAQEPGTPQQIREFCNTRFGVTFPMTEKVNILAEPVHPLYLFLTIKSQNGVADSRVEWNFQKYLLDQKGVLTHVFKPDTAPDSPEISKAIFE